MTNNSYTGVGSAVAVLTALWWHEEVAGRLGGVPFNDTVSCLAKLGLGKCGTLWFVGLHQETQIAGVVFWFGMILAAVGLWRNASEQTPRHK